jgi:molybdopterin synthase catalytic subunit
LGQVRADEIEHKKVSALIYSCYKEMAEKTLDDLREDLFSKYDMKCLRIYHSNGEVNVGQVALFVFLSAAHRQQTFDALHELVDRIKAEVPIWKKEVFADGSTHWV